ncbi:translation elongation factor Ts [Chelatococcus sp. SYSU_G07232]|uniref:Elongation factor Ts n=1 Tax=Chelatococcus albus TaxID=3047466 RepID=A0ABT7ABN8_9HYPH|nr:translation elongation factor Ts [Chelatococcus sp. SYSU_G07232]MDJ1156769.1 translation elongation factor Ts [Chelatococcus sp. SYSU_G07232]
MANITAAMVKELRDKTSAGMMDCKAALAETNGDIEAAVDWLRKKGLAKAAKKSGRVAAEGLVAVESSGHTAAVVEVNSETDFVARNDQFQAFAREAAKIALMGDGTVEALETARFPGSQTTVKERLQELVGTIGENMTIRRVAKLSVAKGVIASYVHNAVADGLGKIGVLVALESTGDVSQLSTLGRQIAMHVAATNPVALDASGVPQETVEREKAILGEKHAGKPANVIEKIVESGLKTYFKEVTLLEQAFIHDPSKSVAQTLKEAEGKVGGPIKLTAYARFALGEGIEKEETDFAAEVAAAAGGQA